MEQIGKKYQEAQTKPGEIMPADEEPQIMRSFSDDGGRTWSNETSRSLGRIGEYKKRQIWRREGQARNTRVYRFVHDSDSNFAVLGLRANLR